MTVSSPVIYRVQHSLRPLGHADLILEFTLGEIVTLRRKSGWSQSDGRPAHIRTLIKLYDGEEIGVAEFFSAFELNWNFVWPHLRNLVEEMSEEDPLVQELILADLRVLIEDFERWLNDREAILFSFVPEDTDLPDPGSNLTLPTLHPSRALMTRVEELD